MNVRVEHDGPVTTVILDRPDMRNAVDGPTAAALAGAFRAFDADDGAHVAVLWGAGGTFCSGADLKAIGGPDGNRGEPDGDRPIGPTRLRLAQAVPARRRGARAGGGLAGGGGGDGQRLPPRHDRARRARHGRWRGPVPRRRGPGRRSRLNSIDTKRIHPGWPPCPGTSSSG